MTDKDKDKQKQANDVGMTKGRRGTDLSFIPGVSSMVANMMAEPVDRIRPPEPRAKDPAKQAMVEAKDKDIKSYADLPAHVKRVVGLMPADTHARCLISNKPRASNPQTQRPMKG